MKILITGNMGYVGPVLARHLRAAMPQAELYGFDSGLFAHALTGAATLPEVVLDRQYFGDVRDLPEQLLQGLDAIVHLAAVSNDPIGHRFEATTEEVNQVATQRLAEMAARAGVGAFVFASSCSMYGFAADGARKETDEVNPLTAYARSKVGAERYLSAMDAKGMAITCLRFATACGMSDRLRFDLVLNDFVVSALSTGQITVLSDGTPWRPLIDVQDMARAIHWAVGRRGGFVAVNAGRDENNYQVRDLAETVARAVPGTTVTINTDAPPDKRSYRVDFSLFRSLAPDAMPQVTLDQSVARLVEGVGRMPRIEGDIRNSPFMRLNLLEKHIADGVLGADLRWTRR